MGNDSIFNNWWYTVFNGEYSESQPKKLIREEREQLTGVDPHVPVPRGPVVERFPADGALLSLFGIAHAGRGHLLHVVVQLQLERL